MDAVSFRLFSFTLLAEIPNTSFLSGKSSLLRAIAGLWTAGVGDITRVPDSEVYFLPQRPYCALGSLKDQLLYPSTEAVDATDYPEGHRLSRAHILRQSLADEELLAILDKVDLKVSSRG